MSSHHKIALVMGVANQRSIAWSCVESLVQQGWKVIFTYQNEKMASRIQPLLDKYTGDPNRTEKSILGAFPYDITTATTATTDANNNTHSLTPQLLELLQDRPLNAVVHSLAHAPNLKQTNSLLNTSLEDYLATQHISAYSLMEIARETRPLMTSKNNENDDNDNDNVNSSITALTYLGAVRAIQGYGAMGPAKASLESIVRGLALELAQSKIRVNAVSAGPLPTLAAKGGIANFDAMRQDVAQRAPLGNVTTTQVADTVSFLASNAASGITGQTIYVDGGYSIVGGPGIASSTN